MSSIRREPKAPLSWPWLLGTDIDQLCEWQCGVYATEDDRKAYRWRYDRYRGDWKKKLNPPEVISQNDFSFPHSSFPILTVKKGGGGRLALGQLPNPSRCNPDENVKITAEVIAARKRIIEELWAHIDVDRESPPPFLSWIEAEPGKPFDGTSWALPAWLFLCMEKAGISHADTSMICATGCWNSETSRFTEVKDFQEKLQLAAEWGFSRIFVPKAQDISLIKECYGIDIYKFNYDSPDPDDYYSYLGIIGKDSPPSEWTQRVRDGREFERKQKGVAQKSTDSSLSPLKGVPSGKFYKKTVLSGIPASLHLDDPRQEPLTTRLDEARQFGKHFLDYAEKPSGGLYLLFGPPGCGKTTFLKLSLDAIKKELETKHTSILSVRLEDGRFDFSAFTSAFQEELGVLSDEDMGRGKLWALVKNLKRYIPGPCIIYIHNLLNIRKPEKDLPDDFFNLIRCLVEDSKCFVIVESWSRDVVEKRCIFDGITVTPFGQNDLTPLSREEIESWGLKIVKRSLSEHEFEGLSPLAATPTFVKAALNGLARFQRNAAGDSSSVYIYSAYTDLAKQFERKEKQRNDQDGADHDGGINGLLGDILWMGLLPDARMTLDDAGIMRCMPLADLGIGKLEEYCFSAGDWGKAFAMNALESGETPSPLASFTKKNPSLLKDLCKTVPPERIEAQRRHLLVMQAICENIEVKEEAENLRKLLPAAPGPEEEMPAPALPFASQEVRDYWSNRNDLDFPCRLWLMESAAFYNDFESVKKMLQALSDESDFVNHVKTYWMAVKRLMGTLGKLDVTPYARLEGYRMAIGMVDTDLATTTATYRSWVARLLLGAASCSEKCGTLDTDGKRWLEAAKLLLDSTKDANVGERQQRLNAELSYFASAMNARAARSPEECREACREALATIDPMFLSDSGGEKWAARQLLHARMLYALGETAEDIMKLRLEALKVMRFDLDWIRHAAETRRDFIRDGYAKQGASVPGLLSQRLKSVSGASRRKLFRDCANIAFSDDIQKKLPIAGKCLANAIKKKERINYDDILLADECVYFLERSNDLFGSRDFYEKKRNILVSSADKAIRHFCYLAKMFPGDEKLFFLIRKFLHHKCVDIRVRAKNPKNYANNEEAFKTLETMNQLYNSASSVHDPLLWVGWMQMKLSNTEILFRDVSSQSRNVFDEFIDECEKTYPDHYVVDVLRLLVGGYFWDGDSIRLHMKNLSSKFMEQKQNWPPFISRIIFNELCRYALRPKVFCDAANLPSDIAGWEWGFAKALVFGIVSYTPDSFEFREWLELILSALKSPNDGAVWEKIAEKGEWLYGGEIYSEYGEHDEYWNAFIKGTDEERREANKKWVHLFNGDILELSCQLFQFGAGNDGICREVQKRLAILGINAAYRQNSFKNLFSSSINAGGSEPIVFCRALLSRVADQGCAKTSKLLRGLESMHSKNRGNFQSYIGAVKNLLESEQSSLHP